LDAEALVRVAHGPRAIEMFPDDDARFGVAGASRVGQNLELMLAQLDGIIVRHHTFVGKAADVLEVLVDFQRAVGNVRVRWRLSEARIVAWEEAREDDIRLGQGAGADAAEFADEAILEGPPKALDAAFGLRGGGGNPPDAELLEGTTHLSGGAADAAQLLGERERLAGIAVEDAVAVAIDGDGSAARAEQVTEDPKVPIGVFLLSEERGGHAVRGIVDGAMEDQAGPAAFQPVVVASIDLNEEALLGHALAAAMMAAGPGGDEGLGGRPRRASGARSSRRGAGLAPRPRPR